MKKIISLLCLFFLFTLVACGSNEENTDDKKKNKEVSSERGVKNFIKKNLEYTQNENIEGVLSQTDCTSINCEEFRSTMENLFQNYDLKYELIDLKIQKISDHSAEVIVKQKTTKQNGPEFRDNVGEFLHTLIKVDKDWKFKSTIVNKVEYLN